MTKNTQNKLQTFKIKCYHNANTGPDNTLFTGINRASALFGALLLASITTTPASAQDKYHDTGTIKPGYTSGNMVLPCSTLYCQLQKLMDLLKQLEIKFYLDFRLYFKIRLKPEEVMRRLSLLENELIKRGKMMPALKSELDALKVMLGKV
ncbi:MAG: hypothetical protein ACRBBN_18505 [Methyloligellaceae bacterium]